MSSGKTHALREMKTAGKKAKLRANGAQLTRKQLLAAHRRALKLTDKLTPRQGFQTLVATGIVTAAGKLNPRRIVYQTVRGRASRFAGIRNPFCRINRRNLTYQEPNSCVFAVSNRSRHTPKLILAPTTEGYLTFSPPSLACSIAHSYALCGPCSQKYIPLPSQS